MTPLPHFRALKLELWLASRGDTWGATRRLLDRPVTPKARKRVVNNLPQRRR